jgi:hypothetical protein
MEAKNEQCTKNTGEKQQITFFFKIRKKNGC